MKELFTRHVRMIPLVTLEANELIADRTLEADLVWVPCDRHARTLLLRADASQVVTTVTTVIQQMLIGLLALCEFFENLRVFLEN